MLNSFDILETIKMIEQEHLDIRTITLGISLRDCCDRDVSAASRRVYDKITGKAEKLVETADTIAREYGIPIINKRVSVTPVSLLADSCDCEDITPLALALERAATAVGIDFIGGYSALVHKGLQAGPKFKSIPGARDMSRMLLGKRRHHARRNKYGRRGDARRYHTKGCIPYA